MKLSNKICSVEGCNDKHYAKGYCKKHYNQVRKNGRISERTRFDKNEIIIYDTYAEIILYDEECKEIARALIDIEDIEKVKDIKWSFDRYVRSANNGSLHRFIMCPDDNLVVDHINHNTLDNRKSNLRICGIKENSINKKKMSNNTSGYTGVYYKKDRNKWGARIVVNKKCIYLGYFNTKEEALEVRQKAEIKYFGEYRYKE